MFRDNTSPNNLEAIRDRAEAIKRDERLKKIYIRRKLEEHKERKELKDAITDI